MIRYARRAFSANPAINAKAIHIPSIKKDVSGICFAKRSIIYQKTMALNEIKRPRSPQVHQDLLFILYDMSRIVTESMSMDREI